MDLVNSQRCPKPGPEGVANFRTSLFNQEPENKTKPTKEFVPLYVANPTEVYPPLLTKDLVEAYLWFDYSDCESWLVRSQAAGNSHSAEIVQVIATQNRNELSGEIISNSLPMIPTSKFTEILGFEVSVYTGIFLNRATETVWSLFIQSSKLMVDVPNFSFQLSPLSPTIFRPVNPAINLEFEFEKSNQNDSFLMHIYAKGIKRATFDAL